MKKIKFEELDNLDLNKNYFIEFSTEWCGDCRMMKFVMDNLQHWVDENNKDVELLVVDADEANLFGKETSEWKVYKVPSFFIINKGIKKHIGYEYLPIDLFKEEINKLDK